MARITSIAKYLPEGVLTNETLASRFPSWSAGKIYSKTGILERRIASNTQTSGDLAIKAAEQLFANTVINRSDIDMLLLVTQTPDQALPSTSCRIQFELGLSQNCGTLDLNQGCSGYIYGLAVANAMINSGTATNVLLLTADTYSKLIDPYDQSVVTLFGDAASATLIQPDSLVGQSGIGPTDFGTDGSGGHLLYCNLGGWRVPTQQQKPLQMDGPSILSFTLSVLPNELSTYLDKCQSTISDFDHVVFHQANKFILEKLYAKVGAAESGLIYLERTGNTVSSTIPIALSSILPSHSGQKPRRVLLGGFGVGLSWGFTSIII